LALAVVGVLALTAAVPRLAVLVLVVAPVVSRSGVQVLADYLLVADSAADNNPAPSTRGHNSRYCSTQNHVHDPRRLKYSPQVKQAQILNL
jgi:hypothetical protein